MKKVLPLFVLMLGVVVIFLGILAYNKVVPVGIGIALCLVEILLLFVHLRIREK